MRRTAACRGRSSTVFYPHGVSLPQVSSDTTHWIVNSERTAWRGERCRARRGRRPGRRVFSRSRTIQPGNFRSPRPGRLPDALVINSASACGFRRGRSPRMRRGPTRKSRGPTMPELFQASSNQLPSIGVLPYELAAVERVWSVCPPPRGTLEGRAQLRAGHQPLGPSLSYAGHAHPHGVRHVAK